MNQHHRSGDQQKPLLEPVDEPPLDPRMLNNEGAANDMHLLIVQPFEEATILQRQALHRRDLLCRQLIKKQVPLNHYTR